MEVIHQEGQVDISFLECEYHVLPIYRNFVDSFHDAERAGLRPFVRMARHGGEHVCRGHLLAIVELHALADLEGPDLGIFRRTPFFRKRRLQVTIRVDLDELFTPLSQEEPRNRARGHRRIETVRGRPALQSRFEQAALDGPRCLSSRAKQVVCQSGADAKRCGST